MQRDTAQRRAIRAVFLEEDRPLAPEEVRTLAAQRARPLGIATIYRNLRTLLDEGWLVTVSVPDQPPRYERAGKPHHHHFVCDTCGRAFDLPGCALRPASLAPAGYLVTGHELTLRGLCADCRQA